MKMLNMTKTLSALTGKNEGVAEEDKSELFWYN